MCIKELNRSNDIIFLLLGVLKGLFVENDISTTNNLVGSKVPQSIPFHSFSIAKKDALSRVVQFVLLFLWDPRVCIISKDTETRIIYKLVAPIYFLKFPIQVILSVLY